LIYSFRYLCSKIFFAALLANSRRNPLHNVKNLGDVGANAT
jgi:hypothetical protein